jgi:hypothetical protein
MPQIVGTNTTEEFSLQESRIDDLCFELARVDTVDSDATVDNAPGPGRALDGLYQAGGRKLEGMLNRLVGNLLQKTSDSNKIYEGDASPPSELRRANTVESIDTEATESDLPGPGRGLDKLYQFAGRKLERTIGEMADGLGFGPAAAERKLLHAGEVLRYAGYVKTRKGRKKWKTSTEQRKARASNETQRYCQLVVKYLRYAMLLRVSSFL